MGSRVERVLSRAGGAFACNGYIIPRTSDFVSDLFKFNKQFGEFLLTVFVRCPF